MKVSVLIPTYNRRRYVVEAIESVIAQDYADMEIIVVDDGSTDGTELALTPYLSRIRLIRTENQGPAAARNVGMEAARGDYIAWLDSDDLYYPFKIRLQARLLDEWTDVGMVYSEFSAFADDGFWEEFHLKNYHASAYRRSGIEYSQLFDEQYPLGAATSCGVDQLVSDNWRDRSIYFGDIHEAYLFGAIVFTNSMMFRRSLLMQTGLQYKKFGMFHDLEFALRICRYTRVAFVDIPTYKLRYHPDQISTTRRPRGGKVAIKIQRDLLRVARHHLLGDVEYYSRHKDRVDRHLARLFRAAAVPLLSYAGGSAHEDRHYPRRARKYLAKCRDHGRSEALLYAMSFSPHVLRRIAFKLLNVRAGLAARKAGS